MAEVEDSERGRSPQLLNIVAGSSLGLLLAILMGLSASPIVSIVITSLVGLLGGLSGISDSAHLRLGTNALQRLCAFALTAAIFVPLAVWVRTHDLLSPTIAQQQALLRQMGYSDGSPEQREMLSYLRFGLLPSGRNAQPSPPPFVSVLYNSADQAFCDNLNEIHAADDVVVLLKASKEPHADDIAQKIATLSPTAKTFAATYATIFMCRS